MGGSEGVPTAQRGSPERSDPVGRALVCGSEETRVEIKEMMKMEEKYILGDVNFGVK